MTASRETRLCDLESFRIRGVMKFLVDRELHDEFRKVFIELREKFLK